MLKKYILFAAIVFSTIQIAQSQVLISLLLGNKLNTDKLKFGLDGGVNFSNISNVSNVDYPGVEASTATNYFLGFYFDILMKENTNWYVHTGVMVKSTMGAILKPPYPLNTGDASIDSDLDAVFATGQVDRKIAYFNVPVLARYKFKNEIFVEAGPMAGLQFKKSKDVFTADLNGDDVTLETNTRKDYHRFDIGLLAGLGYQLKIFHGMNFGVRYYQGFGDISVQQYGVAQRNSSWYLFASIPIGAGLKAQEKNAAAAKKKAEKKAAAEKAKNESQL
jgi:hypothetical protein